MKKHTWHLYFISIGSSPANGHSGAKIPLEKPEVVQLMTYDVIFFYSRLHSSYLKHNTLQCFI